MDIVKHKPRNLVAEFLTNYTASTTRAAYKKDLEDFFTHFQGQFNHPSQVTIAHFIEYRDTMLAEGKSSASVNRKISSIRSLMDWCVNQGVIQFNPARSLKMPKIVIKEPTLAFTDEEVRAVIASPDVNSFFGNMHRLTLVLLFNLGLRRSELVNIKMEDLYEDRGTLLLRIKGKGSKIRVLPLSDTVKEEIQRYLAQYEILTTSTLQACDFLVQSNLKSKNTKAMEASSVFRIVVKYAADAGIQKRVSPHSCRATVISHLLESEVSPRDVANFAGHSSIQTTVNVYDKKRDLLKNSAAFKVNFGATKAS